MLVKAKSVRAILNQLSLTGYFVIKTGNGKFVTETIPYDLVKAIIMGKSEKNGNIFTLLPYFSEELKKMSKKVSKIIIKKADKSCVGNIIIKTGKNERKATINASHAIYISLLLHKEIYLDSSLLHE
ncbi:MAG: hypothetical protein QW061_01355 [Candidatus Rehaiarchaeum fermentans]|nr:hypothetical protein [Candidatus Rehaiarchaeum fermentans]